MKITDLHIHGFGIFAEQELSGFSSGVNVFLGNNEAGKSTCLAFLRYMLFGLPRKGKTISHHEPLRGGNHAGVLGLDTHKFGALRLERSFKPKRIAISDAQGGQMDESALQALLGNVSRDLYTNVYGFSLTELQSKDALTGDAVRNALYGTVHGGGASYTDVMKHLAAKREALFKKKGTKQPLNQHLKSIEQLRKDLLAGEDSVSAYLTVSQQITELEDNIAECASVLRRLGIEAGTVKADMRLWATFTAYKEKQVALEAVKPLVEFPQDGLVRFDNLQRSYREKRDQLTQLLGTIEAATRDIEAKQAQINTELIVRQDVVRALSEEKAVMTGKKRELEQRKLEEKALNHSFQEVLEQLGAGWHAEKIQAFDISDNTRREVAEFEEQAEKARHDVALVQNEKSRLSGMLDDAQRAVEQRANELEQNADLNRFANLKDASAEEQLDLQQTKDILRSVRSRLPLVLTQQATTNSTTLLLTVLLGLIGVVVAAAPSFAPVPSYLLYAGVCMTVAAAIVYVVGTRQQKKKQQEAQNNLLEIMAAAPLIFPQPEVTDECLAQAEDAFEDLQRGLVALEAWQDKLHTAEKYHEDIQEQFAKASRNEGIAQDKLAAIYSKSTQWLEAHGLSSTLRIQHIPETLQLIKETKAMLHQRSDVQARIEAAEQILHAFADQQDAVCKAAGVEPELAFDNTIKRDATQDKLLRILTESQQLQTSIESLTEIWQKDIVSAKSLKISKETLENDIKALFFEANVADEESYRARHALYAQQQELVSEFSALKASLTAASENGDITSLAARIGQQSEQELAVKAAELAAAIEEKEQEQEALRQSLIQAKVEQEKLVSTEEQTIQRTQQEALKEEATMLAKEWARYKIAEHMLSRARERFEREQQPEVVKQAGAFFKTITKGAYSGVFKPLGEENVFALAEDGTRREPEELSRGTAEQLYLSLRLGHILSHSGQNEPLPVIMDDIMVNFDPARAANTAATIAELAAHNQVFLFTCHPQTVKLMEKYIHDVGVYTVTNGVLEAGA
ncbi:AAA family ATPase [Halodesulfovibrio spirochaetisodalis]|uniref:YhaN AAA domain-containing protein n=1 Tax=Halodesulfovibrio spirochaetisodalis TaxID=1560234 RepID=A0A1B7XCP6_9BACT|nr:AAA family ATPase [Halodesulfovibrio spirochaetisodalis]OBQ51732.1 hypothetical protein SP90_09010 [Halodesulfovibrio spirochaetisodalis]